MVKGNGLISSVFIKDYDNNNNFIIFGMGVSNSLETDDKKFKREEILLKKTLLEYKNIHLIYFSTFTDLNEKKKKYREHKLYMEKIIEQSGNKYTIFRLPQIVGKGGNENTLFNYFLRKLKNNEQINVYKNTYKSLIDVDDVKRIVDIYLEKYNNESMIIEIPFIEKIDVHKIVLLIAEELGVKPKINFIDSLMNNIPDISVITKEMFDEINITPYGYTKRLIKKYIK